MSTFGERLREERKRLLVTQDEIADRLGITKQSQGLYERGQRTPNAEYLAGLFDLGGDPAYILTGNRSTLAPQEKELIAQYRTLPEADQQTVQRTVAALAATVGDTQTDNSLEIK